MFAEHLDSTATANAVSSQREAASATASSVIARIAATEDARRWFDELATEDAMARSGPPSTATAVAIRRAPTNEWWFDGPTVAARTRVAATDVVAVQTATAWHILQRRTPGWSSTATVVMRQARGTMIAQLPTARRAAVATAAAVVATSEADLIEQLDAGGSDVPGPNPTSLAELRRTAEAIGTEEVGYQRTWTAEAPTEAATLTAAAIGKDATSTSKARADERLRRTREAVASALRSTATALAPVLQATANRGATAQWQIVENAAVQTAVLSLGARTPDLPSILRDSLPPEIALTSTALFRLLVATPRPPGPPTGGGGGGVELPDYDALIADELRRRTEGSILFNPPAETVVGRRERVEVRIARAPLSELTAELSRGLTGSGTPKVEDVLVATFMAVRLGGDDFTITPLSSEQQIVPDDGFTQWSWDVKARKSGTRSLHLAVSMRIKLPEGREEYFDYPVKDKLILVKVDPVYMLTDVILSNGPWLLAGLAALAAGAWWVVSRRKSDAFSFAARAISTPGRQLRYDDFALKIEPAAGADYTVLLLSSPRGPTRGRLVLPDTVDLSDVGLRRLSDAIRGPGRDVMPAAGALAPPVDVRTLGEALYEALFADDVRDYYQRCRGGLSDSATQGLRVSIHVDPRVAGLNQVAGLPWEYLYDASTRQFLNLNRLTPVVRHLDVGPGVETAPLRLPLRILTLIAGPVGFQPLDVSREESNIRTSWSQVEGVELTTLAHATAPRLREALLDGNYQVVHFIGHGDYDEERGESVIMLENETGQAAPIGGTLLANIFHGTAVPRLVVLNACETARPSFRDGQSPYAGVATTLVAAGVPSVIAMQFPITDAAAILFSRILYSRLTKGDPIDAAVTEARLAIHLADERSLEWGTPALFMRATDSRLVR